MSDNIVVAENHGPATTGFRAWIKRAAIVVIFTLLSSPASCLLSVLALSIFSPDTLSAIWMMGLIGADQAGAGTGSLTGFLAFLILVACLPGGLAALFASVGMLLVDKYQRKVRPRLWLVAVAALIISFVILVVVVAHLPSVVPGIGFVFYLRFVFYLLFCATWIALSVLPSFWGCHVLTKSGRARLIGLPQKESASA